MGYSTIPQALRAAGKTAGDAVESLGGADCGSPCEGVAADLPGSTAANAAKAFADTWSNALKSWRGDAGKHAQALTDAASSYQGTEEKNEHNLAARGPR
ncbi:MAG: hypothetical protein ACRDRN_13625 [Sciscionella sp.]